MFKTAELGHRIPKDEYHALLPDLRARLVQAQYRMRKANGSIIIAMAGNDSVGRRHAISHLAEWLDPRYYEIHAFGDASDEESERPRLWRYWRVLPSNGRTAIFYNSWNRRPLMDRMDGKIDDDELEAAVHRINNFERMLAHDNTYFLKFWLHLSKDAMASRIAAADADPDANLHVNERDRQFLESYDESRQLCIRYVRKTSTTEAPWQILESTDHRYRNVTMAYQLLDTMDKIIESQARTQREASDASSTITVSPPGPASPNGDGLTILHALDLSKSLKNKEYREKLESEQAKLFALGQKAYEQGVSSVLVFEGWDASGKGGAIRRMLHGLDPRDYRVVPIGAPTDEELARHYLWRFWRQLPRAGKVVVFDRSWYGRVLVERVEGFAREDEWRRAYQEINDFEEELVSHGCILLKFWMHIDAEEQLRRFQAREATPFKQHKITEEDWRNRERWDAYEAAVNEMVQRTSTEYAPWHLVEGNDKRFARVKVIRTYVEALEARLNGKKKGD